MYNRASHYLPHAYKQALFSQCVESYSCRFTGYVLAHGYYSPTINHSLT